MRGLFSYHSHQKATLTQRDPWTQYPAAYWCIHICNITLNYLPHPACPAHNNIPSHNLSSPPQWHFTSSRTQLIVGDDGDDEEEDEDEEEEGNAGLFCENVFCQHTPRIITFILKLCLYIYLNVIKHNVLPHPFRVSSFHRFRALSRFFTPSRAHTLSPPVEEVHIPTS